MGSRDDDSYWNDKYDQPRCCEGCGCELGDLEEEYCFWCHEDGEDDCNA